MQSNPVSLSGNSKSKLSLLLLAIIGTFFALSIAILPSSSAESLPVTQYSQLPLSSSLTWNFVQGTNAGNSYFTMEVTVYGNSPPSHVALTYSLYYMPEGATTFKDVQNHGASLNYGNGVTSQSVSFTIPFKGPGTYIYVANFKDNSGKMVAQSIVDPKIEPLW